MADIALEFGADLAQLQTEIRNAERQIIASVRVMERAVSANVGKVDKAYVGLGKSAGQAADTQSDVAKEAQSAARAVNSPDLQEAAARWAFLAQVVATTGDVLIEVRTEAFEVAGAIAGAFLGAKAGADQAASANESLIGSVARLAGAYFSLRQVLSSVNNILTAGAGFESQRLQLEGLFQSAVQGEIAFQWVRDFPIQAQGFSEALRTLQGFGVDDLFRTLSALNDQVILLGDEGGKLQRVALAIGQSFAAGALRAEELNQLIDAGVPVFRLLSSALNVSIEDIRELASSGQLGRREIKLLIDEIARTTTGGADRALASFSGIVGQLSREYQTFLGLIAESGVLDFAKQQISALLAEINRLRETGQLQQIAQNISNSLTAIGGGISRVVASLLAGIRDLAQSGQLETIAISIEGAFIGLSKVIDTVAENFQTLVTAAQIWFAVMTVGKLALIATGWASLIFVVVKFRTAIFAAIAAIGLLLKSMAAAVIGIGRVTTVLAALQALLIRSAFLFGGIAIAIGAVVVGGVSYIRSLANQTAAIRALQREQEAYLDTLSKLNDIQAELANLGFEGVSQQIDEIKRLRAERQLSNDEALQAAQRIAQEAIALNNQLQAKERELADLQRRLREENEEEIQKSNIKIAESKIKAVNDQISAEKRSLNASVRAEKKAADEIVKIRQDLSSLTRRTLEEVDAIRLKGLSGQQQQAKIAREAGKAEAQAIIEVFRARRAQSTEEKKLALEEADRLAKRSASLAGQLESESQSIRLTLALGDTRKLIGKEEIALQEQLKQQAEDSQDAVKERIGTLSQELDKLKDKLNGLKNELKIEIPIAITEQDKLDAEIAAIQQKLDAIEGPTNLRNVLLDIFKETEKKIELGLDGDVRVRNNLEDIQKQLDELGQGVNIPITTSGALPGAAGFAAGGQLSGYGGGDRVHALLEPGEYIVRKEAARFWGASMLSAINRMRTPDIRMRSPLTAGTLQHFQTGGSVQPVAAAPGSRDVVDVNLTIGTVTSRLSGPRDEARKLTDALSRLSRGLPT